jgi:hypothetical protein
MFPTSGVLLSEQACEIPLPSFLSHLESDRVLRPTLSHQKVHLKLNFLHHYMF